jgi:hypothetical protein
MSRRLILSTILLALGASLGLVSAGALAENAPPSSADIVRGAQASGTPDIPGLHMVWLSPLSEPARHWRYILVHQTEGPAGSARNGAASQAKDPTRRGVTLWVETDGTVYWSIPETAIPTQGDGANRNDNKYVDNSVTFKKVLKHNSIGVEFAGNFPDVARPATDEQVKAWLILVRFLQARYGIPPENIYAHNWIDFKDARYCEGCDLAKRARALDYRPDPSAPAATVR